MPAQAGFARRLGAEALGTGVLVATVVGSGVMAAKLAGGNVAIALLCNALATAAILFVLITVLAPISGAHLNPAVSFIVALRGEMEADEAIPYMAAQLVGGLLGAITAHAMFELPLLQSSINQRTGTAQWLSEMIAAFGLLATIIGCQRLKPHATAGAVGLYIGAAYWFTASTSFANPAVTIARAMSDTFSGISPYHVLPFILAQLVGAALGTIVMDGLAGPDTTHHP